MIKCSQRLCNAKAVYEYYWPGHSEPSYACQKHRVLTENVSKSFGCAIHFSKISHSLLSLEDIRDIAFEVGCDETDLKKAIERRIND